MLRYINPYDIADYSHSNTELGINLSLKMDTSKIAEYYTNPRKPGSFSSALKLQKATKSDLKTIQSYLRGKET